MSNETIIIPVVIHVIYKANEQNISEVQIQSQIDALNKDYSRLNADTANIPVAFKNAVADCKIKFCLAKVDPLGRLTSGISRSYTSNDYFLGDDAMKFKATGGQDAWDSKRYLNIWICNLFGRSLGYATLPGSPFDKDGVVINYDVFGTQGTLRAPFNKGRTATHEIGHWMGLLHIWGDDLCGNDGVDDTPSQKSYNFGCPSFPRMSTCSPDSNGDMYMNFMDFVDDACMNMFSYGQKNKMRSCFSMNGFRNTFLDADACDSSLAVGGALPDSTMGAPVVIPEEGNFSVSPNPAQSFISIKGSDNFDVIGRSFEVFNMYGQKVLEFTCNFSGYKANVASLSSGVYMIRTGKKVARFIKL